MICEKLTNSFCVGGARHSSIVSFEGDITETVENIVLGKCVQGNREKSMIVSENILAAEGVGDFFKS